MLAIDLQSKKALILGASQGIGEAISTSLAQAGAQCTLTSRSEDKLKKIVENLEGESHSFFAADHSDHQSLMSHIDGKEFDIVVFNSGGPKAGPISQAQPEEFTRAINQHLGLTSEIVRATMGPMKEKSYGRFISITSTSVKIPIPHLGVSNTVRAAMASYLKTLSLELAPFGITVNNLMPGFTSTPRLSSLMEGAAQKANTSKEEIEKKWLSTVPAGRFGEPSEIAGLAAFIASPMGAYITGQNIAVDGGRLGCL